jgi:hypothetical protein
MATNTNGHLVDDKGNVAVDFVWGNFPLQPNDVRLENGGTVLDYTKDSHNIAEDGWNGYPLYTPNTTGSQTSGVDYVTVPSVIGTVATTAATVLTDLELVVTTASAATNSSKTVTAATRTDGSHQLSLTAAAHGFSAGQLVTISGVDAAANGTWVVDAATTSGTLVVGTTPTSALSLTGLTGAAIAVSGTVKAQTVAAAQKVAAGSAITITPWA